MMKKRYIAPYAAVVNESPIDSILTLSGPGMDEKSTALQLVNQDGSRNEEVVSSWDFDAKENNLGFSDDWFDY